MDQSGHIFKTVPLSEYSVFFEAESFRISSFFLPPSHSSMFAAHYVRTQAISVSFDRTQMATALG